MATFSIGTHTCPCSSICIIIDFHFMASAPLNHHPSLAPLPAESDSQNLTPESGSCDPLCSLDETSSQEFEDSYQPKTDFLKAVAILAAAATGALTINHSWVATNQDLAMALLFVIGYAGIIFEESPAFNKSGVGLLMTVSLWVIRSIGAPSTDIAVSELTHASVEVSEIVFFLLGAMTIVEIVDAHQGFKVVTGNITTQNPRLLLWMKGSDSRAPSHKMMLYQLSFAITTIFQFLIFTNGLFVPSAVYLAVPLALMSLTSKVNGKGQNSPNVLASEQIASRGQLVFSVGLGALIFVPVFKALAGLPPYMGVLLGLCVLWILTDAIHYGESERQKLKVPQALSRIDTQGVLFFLGILLSVSSLEAAGILREIANYLDAHVPSSELIASTIGLISALIDNVPLVADGNDSEFWQLIAFCAGTGGSMLIIGSAAGVAFMEDGKGGLLLISGFAFAALHNLNISLPTLAEVPFLSGRAGRGAWQIMDGRTRKHYMIGVVRVASEVDAIQNNNKGWMRIQRFLATLAITVSILLGNGNPVQCFDGGSHQKQQHSLCEELIIPYGYPCSEHTIQTKDGFLLGLQRVSSSSSLRLRNDGERGPPAGDAWFLNTPDQSLGFILADHGFDVWVGNVRGTRWSHGHISLLEKKKELALYDVAEMINYINSVTNSKIFVVGHSQGTIISFAAFTQPEIVEKVEAAALLSPISYLDHISAPLVLRMVKMHIDQMILTMGIHQLNFKSEWGASLLVSLCDTRLSCNDMLSSITGKNCCFNESRVEFYLEQEPHPSSSKNLKHLFQMIRKGTYSKYDYGKLKNLIEYGKFNPPKFDLSRIPKSLPLWMAYGGNDALADITDFQHTLKELPSTPEVVYLENYGHVDFILSLQAKQDLYDPMISFFKSSGKFSSV
ncbi:Triacylglycerol lipase 1 [Glycine soja]